MSSRDTIRDTPQSKGTDDTDPGVAAPDPSKIEPPVDGATSEKKFDPYKFQANTMPPGLRAELIAAGLPRVDPERIEDTVPPNRVIQSSGAPAVAEDDLSERTEGSTSPVVNDGRNDPTLITRARARPRSQGWGLGLAAFLVVCVVVVILATRGGGRSVASPSSVTTDTASTTQPTVAEPTPSPASTKQVRNISPSLPSAVPAAKPSAPSETQSVAATTNAKAKTRVRQGQTPRAATTTPTGAQPAPAKSAGGRLFDNPIVPSE